MQLDPEAGIEGALDHPLAVHFEDARRREAAHQAPVEPWPDRRRPSTQRAALRPTASIVSATTIWLATLHVWPSPFPPTSVMFLPISSKIGRTRSNVCLGAADHDAERRVLRADLAARHRRVEVVASELADALRELLGGDRRDRAHVDDGLARAQALRDAIGSEQHRLDVRRVGHHRDDDRRPGCATSRADRHGAPAGRGEVLRHAAARVQEERVPAFDQVAGPLAGP